MPDNAPPPVSSTPPPQRKRWLLYGCGGLLAVVVIIIAAVAITVWWIQRPIKPVVLKPKEQAVVDQKLRELEDTRTPAPGPNRPPTDGAGFAQADRPYVPGGKVIQLTEREVNGLLNRNTDLGKTVRLEFARDAINAYLAVPIPDDFPVMGGKMFRARGRLGVAVGNGGIPYLALEDVTVFGVSLP
ncbi:MAG: hypothetical protein ACREIC_20780, partial [Limisphaerales bacterium]